MTMNKKHNAGDENQSDENQPDENQQEVTQVQKNEGEFESPFLKEFDNFLSKDKDKMIASNTVELLIAHIKYNLEHLSLRVRILRLKYLKYKSCYDNSNLTIIIISSLLTLFSAISNQFQIEVSKSIVARHIVGIIPVVFAAMITLIAAVIKFQKLQEKMETISKLNEKSIMTISKLKKTSEDLYFSKSDSKKINELKTAFLNETCGVCNNCIMEMEQIIKDKDNIEYMKEINIFDTKHNKNMKKLYGIEFDRQKDALRSEIFIKDINDQELDQISEFDTKIKNLQNGKLKQEKFDKIYNNQLKKIKEEQDEQQDKQQDKQVEKVNNQYDDYKENFNKLEDINIDIK